MPLDIMPAPVALPGAAPPGPATDSPPGGVPLTGSAALLFGLLLAQTVGQAAPKAPLPLTVTGKGEDKKKDKDKTPAEAMMVPVFLGSPPAPPLPTQTAGPPKPDNTPAASAPKIANTGRAMDTVPVPGGELLSPQPKTAPMEPDLVSKEVSLPALPHAPVPPATPSQAVVVTAAPGETSPSAKAQAAETVTVPTPTPVAQRPVTSDIVTSPPPPPSPAQPAAPISPQTKIAASNAPVSGTAGQNVAAPPVALPTPAAIATVLAAPPAVTVAAVLAAPPSPRNTPMGTPSPALPPTAGLQNGPTTADNQPGKNADGKTAGPSPAPAAAFAAGPSPAQAAKAAARVAAQAPDGKQAPTVQAVPGKELPQDKPVSGASRELHSVDTAPPMPLAQAAPAVAPGQTAATPMPPVDRTQMLAQVTHSLETMTPKVGAAGPQQVTLQLHPKDWGQLHVRVLMTPTVGADGKMSTQVIAHVIAEHPAVKAALETGQGELRHALREAGLQLDRLTVTVQAPAAGSETSAGGSRQESRGGEGWGGAQPVPFGTAAQGGSAFGGRHPAPAAVAPQGQTSPVASQAPGREAEDRDVPVTTITGRVDTRA